MSGQKIKDPKKYVEKSGPNDFGSAKTFGSKIIVGPTTFWLQQNFGFKMILGPTKFWGPKNFEPWSFWVQKYFDDLSDVTFPNFT